MADGGTDQAQRPAVRALQIQSVLRLLPRLPAHRVHTFRTKIDSATIERTGVYRTMSWVPMREHMHVCDTLRGCLGRSEFVALFRDAFALSVDNQLLQPLFGLFRSASPNSVAMLLRNASRLYSFVTRDAGHLDYQPEDRRSGLITMRGWDSHRFSYECWLDSTRGTILGAMRGAGADPHAEVCVDDTREAAGSAVYRVRW